MIQVDWIKNPSRYHGKLISESGALRLLTPSSKARKSKWSEVINWYASTLDIDSLVGMTSRKESDAIVLCIGTVPFQGATAYSDTLGLTLINASVAQAVSMLRTSAKIAAIFSEAEFLNANNLIELKSARTQLPAIISGIDEEGIVFMTAKIILWSSFRRPAVRTGTLIDEIGGVIKKWNGNCRSSLEFSSVALRRELDDNHTLLAFHAHGDSAHINLRHAVICGLYHNEEFVGERRQAGCSDGSVAKETCKRVDDDHAFIARATELKAAEVVLFSCNGFNFSRQLYQSNVNCALALTEGFPAAIVSTFQAQSFTEKELALPFTPGPGKTPRTLPALVKKLDDFSTVRTGTHPWFFCGYPALETLGQTISMKDRKTSFSIPSNSNSNAQRNDLKIRSLSRTTRKALVANEKPGSLSSTELALSRYKQSILNLMENCEASRFFLAGLKRLWNDAAQFNFTTRSKLENLLELSTLIEAALVEAIMHLNRTQKLGGKAEQLAASVAYAAHLVWYWDRQFLAILQEETSIGNLELALNEGFIATKAKFRGICSRCETQTLFEQLEAAFVENLSLSVVTCPVCGPQAAYPNSLSTNVIAPREVFTGNIFNIAINIDDSRNQNTKYLSHVRLIDKGNGRALWNETLEFFGNTMDISLLMPPESSSDLHTLRITVVSDMRIAHVRQRISAVR